MSTNLYVIDHKLTISGPNPRQDKFACRNCHQSGHTAKECPEPRSAEGVECKKCGESKKLENTRWLSAANNVPAGHFAKDCPTGGGGGPRTCRNCDAEDHIAKECPKPKDCECYYNRLKCTRQH